MSELQGKTGYKVTGMSCGHCEAAVREEVAAVPGVESIEVSASDGWLVVTGDGVEPEAVIAAVDEAGYAARPSAGAAPADS